MPGCLHTSEGLVGKGELVRARRVQEERQLRVLPPHEVAVGAVGWVELENRVEVSSGEDVRDGEYSCDGVGGREAASEVAAVGEAAEEEHGKTCGDWVFGFGSFHGIHWVCLFVWNVSVVSEREPKGSGQNIWNALAREGILVNLCRFVFVLYDFFYCFCFVSNCYLLALIN